MARPVSSLESHHQRAKIIDAMAAGRPLTEISSWTDPHVTRAALNRFKSRALAEHDARIIAAKSAIANNVNGMTLAEHKDIQSAVLLAAIDPFVLRATQSDARRDRWMSAAEQGESPDYRVLAALDRNDLTSQEYQARLANRLTTGSPTTVNVAIVCPGGQTSPEPAWSDDAIDIGKK